jgi:hypothetical protein
MEAGGSGDPLRQAIEGRRRELPLLLSLLALEPEQFAAFIKAERERWGDVVRKARLKVD